MTAVDAAERRERQARRRLDELVDHLDAAQRELDARYSSSAYYSPAYQRLRDYVDRLDRLALDADLDVDRLARESGRRRSIANARPFYADHVRPSIVTADLDALVVDESPATFADRRRRTRPTIVTAPTLAGPRSTAPPSTTSLASRRNVGVTPT